MPCITICRQIAFGVNRSGIRRSPLFRPLCGRRTAPGLLDFEGANANGGRSTVNAERQTVNAERPAPNVTPVVRHRQKAEIATRICWLDGLKAATASYPRQERHLVGVSGGVDSRVLLHILPLIGFRNLVVCHLNHNLRGTESLEDSKFVYRLTRRLRLPLYMDTLAALPGTGSHDASAREARLQLFARAAENFSTSSLFLAHHADDQIETFLFNLFRG